jgi:hypothetical protein
VLQQRASTPKAAQRRPQPVPPAIQQPATQQPGSPASAPPPVQQIPAETDPAQPTTQRQEPQVLQHLTEPRPITPGGFTPAQGFDKRHEAHPHSEEFSDFAPAERSERSTAMTFQSIPPPVEEQRRRIRYDLLAGAGLVLALLALLPLLFLRNEPEELRTTPQIPEVGAQPPGEVEIVLNEPVDLTNKVELSWRASEPELDFAVVIAAEGEEEPRVLLAERNLTMTVDVRPGIQYCFLVQATEATPNDDNGVYESDPRGLRGATCRQ